MPEPLLGWRLFLNDRQNLALSHKLCKSPCCSCTETIFRQQQAMILKNGRGNYAAPQKKQTQNSEANLPRTKKNVFLLGKK